MGPKNLLVCLTKECINFDNFLISFCEKTNLKDYCRDVW